MLHFLSFSSRESSHKLAQCSSFKVWFTRLCSTTCFKGVSNNIIELFNINCFRARVLCNGRLETRVTPSKEGIPPQKTTNVVLGKQLSAHGNKWTHYIPYKRHNVIHLVYKQHVLNISTVILIFIFTLLCLVEDIVIMNDPRRDERQRDQDYSDTSLEDNRDPPL